MKIRSELRRVAIVSAYLLCCSTFGCGGGGDATQFDLSTATSPARTFVEASLTRVGVIPNDPSVMLSRPEVVRADSFGNVLVMDFSSRTVMRFNANGVLLNTYGRGYGQGPGELGGSLVDMRVIADNRVAVLELNERRLQIFDLDGGFVETKLFQRGLATRFSQNSQGRTYFLNISGDFVLTTEFDGVRAGFGQLFESPQSPFTEVFLREGNIDAVGEDIVYVPMRTPVVLRYSPDGSQVFGTATPDLSAYSPPEVEEIAIEGGRGARPSGVPINALISVDNSNIFVRSYIERAIDVYDVDNGAYKYSFSIPPGGPGRYVRGGRYIHQEQDTLVVIYELSLPDES